MRKIKVDENLPREVVEVLVRAGHDAVSVLDQSMGGESDPNLIAACERETRALMTLDLDFADIRAYPPASYSGIIVLRLARLSSSQVVSVVNRLLALLENEPLSGKLWIVDETSVRVRG